MARWQAIVEAWPIDRLLATLDFELSTFERTQIENIHKWLFLVSKYIRRFALPDEQAQVYCFGCAHGDTVTDLVKSFRFYDISIPHLNLFDSFLGLPDERPGVSIPPIWYPGAFVNSLEKFKRRIAFLELPPTTFSIYSGWFKDTLPNAPIDSLSILRLDGDMYSSTMDALENLYPKLSVGGYCIVDDYCLSNCKAAVDDYRAKNSITAEFKEIDWSGSYWRKEK